MNPIVEYNKNPKLLEFIINSEINPDILNEGICSVDDFDDIIKIIENKNMWDRIDTKIMPGKFLSKCMNFMKLDNKTYINLLKKHGEILFKIDWNKKKYKIDENFDELIEFLIDHKLTNWERIIKKYNISEQLIEKHINEIYLSKIPYRRTFSENFLMKFGNRIKWSRYPKNMITQKIFEKYHEIIGKRYPKLEFILNHDNYKNYKTFTTYRFIMRCEYQIFKKLVSEIKINYFRKIVFLKSEDYDEMTKDEPYAKFLYKFNFSLISKKINFSKEFIDYLFNIDAGLILRKIIMNQQIPEKILENHISYITNRTIYIKKKRRIHHYHKENKPTANIDILINYVIVFQKFSENFARKYIKLDDKNMNLIYRYQFNYSPEFFKGHTFEYTNYALNHKYSDEYKINLIKNEKIEICHVYSCGMIFTKKIIDYFMNIPYKNFCYPDTLIKLCMLCESTKQQIFQQNELKQIIEYIIYYNELYEKIHYINYDYRMDKIKNYVLENLNSVFQYQIYIPIKAFKLASNCLKKGGKELYRIISENKEIYIDEYSARIIHVSPRLNPY
jgi:hypothetical protein